jgi:Zn-dependent peptidase ImmA (M78 family)
MELTLNPDLLQWARERARLTRDDLAQKMGLVVKRVEEWEESGKIKADWAQRLADKTHAPYGYLFLKEPPEVKLDIPDFRTLEDKGVRLASTELVDTVDIAILRQDWYREYLIAEGEEPLAFVGSITPAMSIVKAAAHIRDTMAIGTEVRRQESTWEDALRVMVAHIEERGVLVMRNGVVGNNTSRPLSVEEFRGFAIADEYAPLIFINGADYLSAQMFTLAHELVHVFVKASGISNLQDTFSTGHAVERFCNQVAAEVLVPEQELRPLHAAIAINGDPSDRLARHFKVSIMVMLRRMLDLELITKKDFIARISAIKSKFDAQRAQRPSGGSFYNTYKTRTSGRFARAIIASTLEGRTSYREGLKLLGLAKYETFQKVAREFNFQV